MIIVGDAAHATSPSSGQGASMAIEDAVVLAKCLRDLMLPVILKRVASGTEKSLAWLYDYHISWDEKLADKAGRGRPKPAGELMR